MQPPQRLTGEKRRLPSISRAMQNGRPRTTWCRNEIDNLSGSAWRLVCLQALISHPPAGSTESVSRSRFTLLCRDSKHPTKRVDLSRHEHAGFLGWRGMDGKPDSKWRHRADEQSSLCAQSYSLYAFTSDDFRSKDNDLTAPYILSLILMAP